VKHDGPHIRHGDLDAFLHYGAAQGYRPALSAAWGDETVPVIGLRRRIADNMAAAKRHIPTSPMWKRSRSLRWKRSARN
jgi:2-oxoisovalerate dehydrogenase E2 component (dihydrolipoyl transacylase)